MKKYIYIFIIISSSTFANCGLRTSGFNDCGFESNETLSYLRFNEEIDKLENKINDRLVVPMILERYSSGDIITKTTVEKNLDDVLSVVGVSSNIVLSDSIVSSEIIDKFDESFNHVKSLSLNVTQSSLFSNFSQESLSSWLGYNPSVLNNDDIGLNCFCGFINFTSDDTYASNINRGIVFNFNSPIVLKTIKLFYSGNNSIGKWRVSYWNGSSWISIKDFPTTSNSGNSLKFNEDSLISSSKYKIFINEWTPANANLYLYEAQSFKH
jgi:hypothetical protein